MHNTDWTSLLATRLNLDSRFPLVPEFVDREFYPRASAGMLAFTLSCALRHSFAAAFAGTARYLLYLRAFHGTPPSHNHRMHHVNSAA
jgi:hypothetical protein